MKRIIISGGGTRGHIYPAITIYKEIMKQNPDAQVLYVGTERGLEATLVPKEGIEFTTLPVQGLQRKLSFGTLVTLGKTAFSWYGRLCLWSYSYGCSIAQYSNVDTGTKCHCRHYK